EAPSLPTHLDIAAAILKHESGLVELVIPPRSPLIGYEVFPGMVTSTGDSVVLAVRRRNEELSGPHIALEVGDSLLLEGSWEALRQHAEDPRLLVVDSPDLIRRQAVQLGPGSGPALVILTLMILALVTGIVPAVMAGLLAAGAMVLFRVLSVEEAYRGISGAAVFLVAGMDPPPAALVARGAAQTLAASL